MINIKKYNRIVSFGCSWTAGSEINDHKILGMSFRESYNYKKRLGQEKFYKRHYDEVSDAEINKNAAWAAHLAKNLDMDYLSLAVKGNSMDGILVDVISSLYSNKIRKKDLVVVGLTTPQRILEWPESNPPQSKIIGLMKNEEIDHKVFRWGTKTIWTDNMLLLNYIKVITTLCELKRDICLQWMRHHCFPIYGIDRNTLDDGLYGVYNNTLNKYNHRFLLINECLQSHPGLDCGFGHPGEQAHIDLAEKITKALN